MMCISSQSIRKELSSFEALNAKTFQALFDFSWVEAPFQANILVSSTAISGFELYDFWIIIASLLWQMTAL